MEELDLHDPRDRVTALRGALDEALERLAAADRAMSSAAALKAALTEQVRGMGEMLRIAEEEAARERREPRDERPRTAGGRDLFDRSLRAEVACLLRIPERTAETQLAISRLLLRDAPATFSALADGMISERQARVIAENLPLVPEPDRESVEQRALRDAARMTGTQFTRRMRQLVARAHPESLSIRRKRAEERRGVWVTPADDGMAYLEAYLPAQTAVGIHDRLTSMAIAVTRAESAGTSADTASRTRDQLRADAFADLLLDGEIPHGPDVARGIRPNVAVAVPVLSLIGTSDEPAQLDGYGPIDADAAKEIAASAPGFTRLLTHPETGIVLSVGRDRYRPPEELRRWIRLRDGTCRFAGCRMPAKFTEIDHRRDWHARNGPTADHNLACLCVGHHTLKTVGRWSVRDDRDRPGDLVWTSPGKREYRTEPAYRTAFTRPPDPPPF